MNLVIFELEDCRVPKPIYTTTYTFVSPLWSNMNEIFYPQDNVDGKLNRCKDYKIFSSDLKICSHVFLTYFTLNVNLLALSNA